MSQLGQVFMLKPSRRSKDMPSFDFDLLINNSKRGVETVIVPDTNLMIEIEKAADESMPATDATLEKCRLLDFVNFLRECDNRQLPYCFSPSFAFQEIPNRFAGVNRKRYDQFGPKFGVSWVDDPQGKMDENVPLGRSDIPGYEFLGEVEQKFFSVPYATLMLMLIVQRDGKEFSPIGKFRRFLREVVRYLDIISTKEIMVAKYVFAEPTNREIELLELCRDIRKNFGKYRGHDPSSPEEMDAAALNGAFDLSFVNLVNLLDSRSFDGHSVDSWIATMDRKLYRFSTVCYHHDLGTGQAGIGDAIQFVESEDCYWQQAQDEFERLYKRRVNVLVKRLIGLEGTNLDDVVRKVNEIRHLSRVGLGHRD